MKVNSIPLSVVVNIFVKETQSSFGLFSSLNSRHKCIYFKYIHKDKLLGNI